MLTAEKCTSSLLYEFEDFFFFCSLAPCHQPQWDPGQGSSATQPRCQPTVNPKGQTPGVRFPLQLLQLDGLPPASPLL